MHFVSLGSGSGYTRKCYLMYSGRHYDCIVRTPAPGSDESHDERTFATDDNAAAVGALQLAAREHKVSGSAYHARCLLARVERHLRGAVRGLHAENRGCRENRIQPAVPGVWRAVQGAIRCRSTRERHWTRELQRAGWGRVDAHQSDVFVSYVAVLLIHTALEGPAVTDP